MEDLINNPKHYTSHPSGIECIDLVRRMGFFDGNVVKYIWRRRDKDEISSVKKAIFYLTNTTRSEFESRSQYHKDPTTLYLIETVLGHDLLLDKILRLYLSASFEVFVIMRAYVLDVLEDELATLTGETNANGVISSSNQGS